MKYCLLLAALAAGQAWPAAPARRADTPEPSRRSRARPVPEKTAPPGAPVLPLQHKDDSLLLDYLWEELADLPPGRRPRVGLALSGGAARGFAHVGIINTLTHADFPVDLVAGTSMGALVGVAFASGMPAERMKELAIQADIRQGTNLGRVSLLGLLLTNRLLSSEKIERYLERHLGKVQFHQTKKPFACVATDIKTGEKIVFREGPVAPAVRASMNLPGIFKPVEYRHRYLVDGGVVDFIPVDLAREMGADWVLASITEGDYTLSTFANVFFTMEQVIDISGSLLARRSAGRADFSISPQVGDIKIYEFGRSREAMEKGMLEGRRRIWEAKRALALFSLPWLHRSWSGGPGGR